jgi:hypothetical protein
MERPIDIVLCNILFPPKNIYTMIHRKILQIIIFDISKDVLDSQLVLDF